jgi:GTP-binding protein
MPFMAYCPLVFISAKTGHNIPELMGEIGKAHEQFHRRFETEELEAFFWSQIQERPYSHRGRKLIFKTAEQVASSPPTLVIRSNLAEADVHFSYQRHLESVFRQKFGLSAVPLHLRFRRK